MEQKTVLPNDTLLVGFDFTHGTDNDIMIVGRKAGKTIEIVNAFQGEEARELFNRLTTVDVKKELNENAGSEAL